MRVPDALPVGGTMVLNDLLNGQSTQIKVYTGLRSMTCPMISAIISHEAPNESLQCIIVLHSVAAVALVALRNEHR